MTLTLRSKPSWRKSSKPRRTSCSGRETGARNLGNPCRSDTQELSHKRRKNCNGLRDVGRLQPEQNVLIIGAGTYAVQLAKAFGAVVTGVCSTSKAELVLAIGADEVIDYTREDFTDGTRHVDLILDTAGRRPLSHLRRALTPQGTLVIVGGEGGDRWLGGFQRQISAPLRALFTEQKLMGLKSKERQQDLLTLKDLIEAGKLTPVIDRTYPLCEAPQAIGYLEQGHARGKIVLTVSN
jgi:NADPH:quinone reductase-like Zn-dependent oxidoreductase